MWVNEILGNSSLPGEFLLLVKIFRIFCDLSDYAQHFLIIFQLLSLSSDDEIKINEKFSLAIS